MTVCEHVYKNTGAVVCISCGGATHETNWNEIARAHKAHQEWVKENPQEYTWWSI